MTAPLWFGPYGSTDLPADVKEYGVNTVWFHGFNEKAFDDCGRLGLNACVEFKTFRADFGKRPELTPIGADGKPIRYGRLVQGVCLSRRDFLLEIEEQLEEGLKRFRPSGIWLDYLTYGGWFETPEPDLLESCFCPDCIDDFREATGIDADTPERILASHAGEWRLHKCRKVAGYALRYAEMIRSRLPDCVIGAYMCPWTPEEYDGALGRIFAQDYALLAPAIDVYTPLIYCRKSGRPNDWGRSWLNRSAEFVPQGRGVQLILDVLDFPDSMSAAAEAKPAVRSGGVQLYGGAPIFGDRDKALEFKRCVERMVGDLRIDPT